MFKFRGREVFYLLGKVKTFPNEKSNNVKQILVLLLLYANPTVAAMEENQKIEEAVVYLYGEKMCLKLGVLGSQWQGVNEQSQ